MSYNIMYERATRSGRVRRENYTNTTMDVADFMLADAKTNAPKSPAYVRVEVLKDGALVKTYDSRMGVTIILED